MNSLPAVAATSLNPFGRLPEQLRVLRQWRRLGVEMLSFNVEAEAVALIAAGAPRASIVIIDPEDTTLEESGKPIPLIAPLLRWMERERPGRRAILVNSDIYPAARTADFLNDWLAIAPALALTREETPVIEDYDIDSLAPYRGGLDAFVFSPDGLKNVNRMLASLPASAFMCFGVPGWDYLLGAVVEHRTIGGVIMDSGLLLHQSHETTYVDIKAFDLFRPTIVELVGFDDGGFAEVAEAFASRIEASCLRYGYDTSAIRSVCFQIATAEHPPSAEARRIAMALRARPAEATQAYGQAALVALIDGELARGRPNFYTLCNFFIRSKAKEQRFYECLLATLCGLFCQTSTEAKPLPEGYDRAAALANIRRDVGHDAMQRRLEVAYLFGAEMVDHASFDDGLFADLAMSCENDQERVVLKMIDAERDRIAYAS